MAEPFVIRRRVLFGDCDPSDVLYAPRAGDYVVEASLAFLSHRLGRPAERYVYATGVLLPARALSVDFLKPLSWDDELALTVEVLSLRTHALVFSVTGRRDGETVLSGQLTQVCVSRETRRPSPIPQALRDALAG